jgi:hypothetical protein
MAAGVIVAGNLKAQLSTTDIFAVTHEGHVNDVPKNVVDIATRRVAKIAMEHGFQFFEIIDISGNVAVYDKTPSPIPPRIKVVIEGNNDPGHDSLSTRYFANNKKARVPEKQR